MVRASQHCRRRTPGPGGDCLGGEAVRACLRGQTFFSLGLRFLYLFIPLVGLPSAGSAGLQARAAEAGSTAAAGTRRPTPLPQLHPRACPRVDSVLLTRRPLRNHTQRR